EGGQGKQRDAEKQQVDDRDPEAGGPQQARAGCDQVEPPAPGRFCEAGRSEPKPCSRDATAEPRDEPALQKLPALRVEAGRAPAALRSTDALRHRSSRRVWPIAARGRNADDST